MMLRGYIKDGVVILDDPSALPDGTEVDIRARGRRSPGKDRSGSHTKPRAPKARSTATRPRKNKSKKRPAKSAPSFFDRYRALIGSVKGMPSDFAANHDHYIHGTPKRS